MQEAVNLGCHEGLSVRIGHRQPVTEELVENQQDHSRGEGG